MEIDVLRLEDDARLRRISHSVLGRHELLRRPAFERQPEGTIGERGHVARIRSVRHPKPALDCRRVRLAIRQRHSETAGSIRVEVKRLTLAAQRLKKQNVHNLARIMSLKQQVKELENALRS